MSLSKALCPLLSTGSTQEDPSRHDLNNVDRDVKNQIKQTKSEWCTSALDKLLGQLGIYATWLSSIAYLQKQLRIFIFFYATFFSVITPFLIA